MMYKCLDCGCLFEQPSTYTEDCTPGGVFEGGSFIQRYEECPECGGAFGSVEECDVCGEWVYTAYGNPFSPAGFACQLCDDKLGELEDE